MPWSVFCHTFVAHSACVRHRQRRWQPVDIRVKQDRVEHRLKTPFWRWSKAPFPIRRDGLFHGRERVERRLREIPTAIDPVHDLQHVLGRLDVGHELQNSSASQSSFSQCSLQ
jgi:hypothetical protein